MLQSCSGSQPCANSAAYVSPTDRAGEPAGRAGPRPGGVPQPRRWDPHTAAEQDRRTVGAHASSASLWRCWVYFTATWQVLTVPSCVSRIRDCSTKPKKEFVPKPRTSLDFSISENHNGGIHSARSPGETTRVKKHVKHKLVLGSAHCAG